MSAAPRALWPALAGLGAGATVQLTGDPAHHLARVVRVAAGDALVLFDGEGREVAVHVAAVDGRGHRATVTVTLAGDVAPGVTYDSAGVVWLQGYPKGDKLDTVVRQATELGARAVWPVITQRSVPRPKDVDARTARLRAIAASAAAQCGRADVPEVRTPAPLAAALAALPADVTLRVLPWEEGGASLGAVLRAAPAGGGCAVLVGPEGGLAAAEVADAQASGFRVVSLGPRILRTETVAPAVLGVLGYARGDLA